MKAYWSQTKIDLAALFVEGLLLFQGEARANSSYREWQGYKEPLNDQEDHSGTNLFSMSS